jgi:hypothetical protein
MKIFKVTILAMMLVLGACSEDSAQSKVDVGNAKIDELNQKSADLRLLMRKNHMTMPVEDLKEGVAFCDEYIKLGEEVLSIINDPEVVYYGDESVIHENIRLAEETKLQLSVEINYRPQREREQEIQEEERRQAQERAREEREARLAEERRQAEATRAGVVIELKELSDELNSLVLGEEFDQKSSRVLQILGESYSNKILSTKLKLDSLTEGRDDVAQEKAEATKAITNAKTRYFSILAELAWRGVFSQHKEHFGSFLSDKKYFMEDVFQIEQMQNNLTKELERLANKVLSNKEDFTQQYVKAMKASVELIEYMQGVVVKTKSNSYDYDDENDVFKDNLRGLNYEINRIFRAIAEQREVIVDSARAS